AAAWRYYAAGADRHCPGSRSHPHAGDQPGRAELRAAIRDYPAGYVHAAHGPDGRADQSPRDYDPRHARSGVDCGVKYLPAVSNYRQLAGGIAMFNHLLVPLDGSKLAEAILPAAAAWAERLHARLTLLHITEKNAPATIHGEHHLGST